MGNWLEIEVVSVNNWERPLWDSIFQVYRTICVITINRRLYKCSKLKIQGRQRFIWQLPILKKRIIQKLLSYIRILPTAKYSWQAISMLVTDFEEGWWQTLHIAKVTNMRKELTNEMILSPTSSSCHRHKVTNIVAYSTIAGWTEACPNFVSSPGPSNLDQVCQFYSNTNVLSFLKTVSLGSMLSMIFNQTWPSIKTTNILIVEIKLNWTWDDLCMVWFISNSFWVHSVIFDLTKPPRFTLHKIL